ncbi:lipoyl(octanoyl) transferase LipB [Phormidium sp. LEGE 05292]|uniref:lipoyl(octanoyl) transferase LipB n=1 Tax=[Phormidium] sp. LEGE 05292 TaxID=767427 RepID=UPI00187E45A7|nr:lipoyl(octanoyl) transferase LipB [Phormidium sp. LEGE 05292]MBE9227313.1 lipoyl(octanoyl) transferase LipB [Phormidium sp. LEGE 05292]
MISSNNEMFGWNIKEKSRFCWLFNQGLVDYKVAWEWQRSLVAARREQADLPDVLILLEHSSVYTLGTGATQEFIKFNLDKSDYQVYRIERGGEVTYHCPGQLVGYPILNLRHYRQDLHWYLRQLEEVLIRVLASYDLPGERLPGYTGVWLSGCKVAAIGVKVSRWITMHGFALNICPDLTGFSRIVPCGIADKPVGSLSQFIPDITVEEVRGKVAIAFAEVFGVPLVEAQINHL